MTTLMSSLVTRLATTVIVMMSIACVYPQAGQYAPPMGLTRLSAKSHDGEAPSLAAFLDIVDFAKLPLGQDGKTPVKRQGPLAYVEVSSGDRYQISLRDVRTAPNYVTFAINASVGTEIRVGGVTLGVANSIDDSTYGSLMYQPSARDGWTPLGYEAQMLPFGGTMMVSLAPVTVKLDGPRQCWSVWIADNMVAQDVPLSIEGAKPLFTVTGGSGPAWLWGLVHAAENPLFDDGNHNAVPDDFERESLGVPLGSSATAEEQSNLFALWRGKRGKTPPTALSLLMPAPDFIPEFCGPDGMAPLHNMPNAFRFQTPNN